MEITGAPSIVHCRRNLEKSRVISSIEHVAFLRVSCGHMDGLQPVGATWVNTCDSSMWITELSLVWGNPQLAHGHKCLEITEVLMLVRFSFVW